MQVQRVNFPSVISDNEETYLKYLEGLILSVDSGAYIVITHNPLKRIIRVSPSDYRTFHTILDVVKKFHTMLGVEVDFSKSMKTSNNITFSINLENHE